MDDVDKGTDSGAEKVWSVLALGTMHGKETKTKNKNVV